MEHPDDYTISYTPIKEFIYHNKLKHNRLLLRISFKIEEDEYVPITLVCDTGLPGSLYLCDKTRELLNDRIKIDKDFDIEYITVNDYKCNDGKKLVLNENPDSEQNVNFLGLNALNYYGLSVRNQMFEIMDLDEYF